MEQTAPAGKQRSPWFYALLGCGGLAGLICIGSAVAFGLFFKAAKDIGDGIADPGEKRENAIKQLGAIPQGYDVVASVSLFGAVQTTLLTDRPALPDGGFEATPDGHTFTYVRVMANENNRRSKDFLMGKDTDASTLAQSGITIDPNDVIKRGQLTVEGRKLYTLAFRGAAGGAAGAPAATALGTVVLFDCGTEALHVGVWSQADPAPGKDAAAIDLAGTVADEERLAAFLKPLRPCGR